MFAHEVLSSTDHIVFLSLLKVNEQIKAINSK